MLNVKVLKNEADRLRLNVEGINVEFNGIIAKNEKMIEALGWAVVYGTRADILCLTGESGTGKEVFFRAICRACNAAKTLNVNCSSLTENLLESELFGHKKGSFTDAYTDRNGAFMEASGGILFLDEIGDMSLAGQAKLLRAVEYREIKPVGHDSVYYHNAKVILATNKNIKEEVLSGRFRRDLYYRIESFSVKIPPLRERPEDIESLARYFAGNNYKFSERAIQMMNEYKWPGNVRELKNAVERAKVKSLYGERPLTWEMMGIETHKSFTMEKNCTLKNMEKQAVSEAFNKCEHNISRTSRMLGIPRSTLYSKLKKFELIS
ncbi:MAG: sigma-54-dependent Fis family transcriptional regulator [Oligoflexia bacterium]|nr:sigma-54-dependent Fis family transcriptional regulator [Oligoflexia bacterium]